MDVSYPSEADLFGSLSTGDTYSDSETLESRSVSLRSLTPTTSSGLSSASEGAGEATVSQIPRCPIGELSFYHGLGSSSNLTARLSRAGDFLLFCDVDNDCRPSLLVLNYNCSSVGVFPFEQNEEGEFFIEQAKLPNASFRTVGQAMQYYKEWGTMLQAQSLGVADLYIPVREIVDPLYEQMHLLGAKGIHWTYLPFYHGHLPRDQLSSRLERNGDFLLLAANDQHVLRLCVRWDVRVKILKVKLQPNSGRYALPRTNKLQPIEIVSSVEEYIKALVVGQCVLDNCILKRPVNCPIVRRGQYRCYECCVEAMDSQHGVPKNILRPLCSLPYYHGERRDAYGLFDRFVTIGDYGLYFSTATKCLALLVCHQPKRRESTYVVCFKIIRTADDVFHLERHSRRHSFGTVSELIDFYVNNRIKLKTRFFDSAVRLVNPVRRDGIAPNERSCPHKLLPYFFPMDQLGSCEYMFEGEGDFLLKQCPKDNSPCLCVLVRGRVKVVELGSVERNGRYQLPRVHRAEPVEWVDGVDEFIRSSIAYGMPIFGVLPRRAVLCDSPLQKVRRPKFKRKRRDLGKR